MSRGLTNVHDGAADALKNKNTPYRCNDGDIVAAAFVVIPQPSKVFGGEKEKKQYKRETPNNVLHTIQNRIYIYIPLNNYRSRVIIYNIICIKEL